MKTKDSDNGGGNGELDLRNAVPVWKIAAFPAACFVAAFVIRFLLLPRDMTINGDGIYYVANGQEIISGHIAAGISAYWSPIYSALVGFSSLFFQDTAFAGRMVSLLAGSLLVVPSYFLIREIFGERPAYPGTMLVVVHPALIASSGWVMTESLYALLFATMLLTGWYALKTLKLPVFFATGLLLGTLYLTKPEAVFFAGLFGVLTLARRFFSPKPQLHKLAAGYLVLLAGLTVFFLPYVVFIHQKTGDWTISKKLTSNSSFNDLDRGLLKLTDDGQTTMQDRIWWDRYEVAAGPAQTAPPVERIPVRTGGPGFDVTGHLLKTLNNLKRQIRVYTFELLPIPLLLFAFLGFFLRRSVTSWPAKEGYLLTFVACTYLGYAATVMELRYLYALLPVLLGWVALGTVSVADLISKRCEGFLKIAAGTWRAIILALSMAVLIVSFAPLLRYYFGTPELKDVPFEERRAGLWLNHHSKPDSLVMARHATVAYYAGARHIFLPDEGFNTILEYARRKQVDYIVLSERRLGHHPDAFHLADDSGGLEMVFQDRQDKDYEIRIYRVRDVGE